MNKIDFDEATHTYTVGGKVVPSVTTVLQPLTKLWTAGANLETARQEGNAIHKMVELECKGELDEEGLPEWLRPFLKAWRDFVAHTGFVTRWSEYKAYSPTYGYAGTCDLCGVLTKIKGAPDAVIDIKRTLGGKTLGMQLAGYEHLLIESTPLTGKLRRFGLCLDPVKFVEYTEARDWTDFLTALSFHNLQQRMGKK